LLQPWHEAESIFHVPHAGWFILLCSALARTHDLENFLSSIPKNCCSTFAVTMLWYDTALCAFLYVIISTTSFISSPECTYLSPSTCKLLFMFLLLILYCPSAYCIFLSHTRNFLSRHNLCNRDPISLRSVNWVPALTISNFHILRFYFGFWTWRTYDNSNQWSCAFFCLWKPKSS